MFEYVCFNITSECNLKCLYCYRVGNTIGSVSLEQARKYIDILCDLGCTTINITGGEPLLNKNWKSIISYCNEKGLRIVLSTNALLLNIDDPILNKITVLSIPLDSPNPIENDRIKIKGHFNKVKEIIEKYISNNYPFKLKINTVVTPDNINELEGFFSLVNHENIIWKLFKLRTKGAFYSYPKEFCNNSIVYDSFNKIQSHAHKCSIFYLGGDDNSNKTLKPNYLVLNYDGFIYEATESSDNQLFNLNTYSPTALNLKNINNQYNEELKNDIQRN